ncbi:MAG: hypothetical protein OXF74_02670 [Rhodobacteraceae bacterium]|nr:hypothetical protein [Paracoccaceae bacterium]
MSALDGWIDVCRTGTWRDARGREVRVTQDRLDGIVAAYTASDPAPVVVGHPELDAPAYGHVEALRRTGDRLQARLGNLMPAFREAVEAGRYTGRSIALNGDTLRHLGFLGGRAPAVDGLAPTRFGAPADGTVVLAESELADGTAPAVRAALRSISRIARLVRERIISSDGVAAADELLPDWEISSINRIADDLDGAEETPSFSQPDPKEVKVPEDTKQTDAQAPDAAALAAREADLTAREARLAAAEKAAEKAAALAACERLIEPHVTAGRLLPGEKAPLAALMASLPEGGDTLEFAAPEGDGTVRKEPRGILCDLLAALPARVDYRQDLAGGAMPQGRHSGAEDDRQISQEASALMADAAAKGITITVIDAVDRVRARRGLTN